MIVQTVFKSKAGALCTLALPALLLALVVGIVCAEPVKASESEDVAPRSSGVTAASAPEWIDGTPVTQTSIDCLGGGAQALTQSGVGYWGATDSSSPNVGDVYWMHLLVGTGQTCANALPSGLDTKTAVYLPPNTQLAIDSTHKVRCFFTA
jgi:hypothetical protein